MKFKKILSIIILFLIFIPTLSSNASFEDLTIYSPSVILIDSKTGKVLYEKEATQKMYPASITKIMTAILVLENCNLSDKVKVSYNSVMTVPAGYSIANLQIGEEFSINDLLHALLIKSANDSANVLAEHVSGSISEFANLMNKKALELGCTNTNFVNPSGIHNSDHYTTAADMMLIAKYCMQNETFRSIVTKSTYTLPSTDKYQKEDRIMLTTNDMLRLNTSTRKDNYYYEYCIGIKTGYTSQAKNTLISAASRDGMEFIAVILNAGLTSDGLSHRYLDSITLFNYAFNSYNIRKIMNVNDFVTQTTVKKETLDLLAANSITSIVKTENFETEFKPEINLKEDLKAPIKKGELVGTATYDIEGIIYTIDLAAGNDIKKTSIISIIFRFILILFIFYIIILVLNKNQKKKKSKRKSTIYNHYQ